MIPDPSSSLISEISGWLWKQPDVTGLLLVGSYARGSPRPDSDVDLVILTNDKDKYLDDLGWTQSFGGISKATREIWGQLTSIRVKYESNLEVEFGITTPQWASVQPVDPGTRRAVTDAAKILFDREGKLKTLLITVRPEFTPETWHAPFHDDQNKG